LDGVSIMLVPMPPGYDYPHRFGVTIVGNMKSLIESVSARVEVSTIAAALPLYQGLAGVDEAPIREFPGLKVAVAGPFLLIEGDAEVLEKLRRAATLYVNNLDAAVELFVDGGGEVIEGPTEAAGGTRVIVQDADGNVFECFRRGSGSGS
jgi:predicted enzyme related to lactoylglutathione lyase